MNDILDAIVQYDDLTTDQQAVLHQKLASNPELAQLFHRWRLLHSKVGEQLYNAVPDRRALVLYALAQDDTALLTDEEKGFLTGIEDDIQTSVQQHPALQDVIEQIQTCKSDFFATWNRYTGQQQATTIASRAPGGLRSISPAMLRIAATFLVLVLASASTILILRSQKIETIKTKSGEFRLVELGDGSTIRLFGKSKMTYKKALYAEDFDRSIYLNGRAFFDVTPNTQPFRVETPTALTTAIGTRFSIDANRSRTEVVLTDGQVAVDSKQRRGNVVTLSPGHMSQIERREAPSPPQPVENLTEKLSWTGLSVFRSTPLRDVAEHFSQHFDQPLTISPALSQEPFNGSFDPDTLSIDELLNTLSTAFGASYESTEDEGYLLY